VDEDVGRIQLAVMREGGCTGEVLLRYAFGGTATVDVDYLATEGELFWADQDSTDKLITIDIVNDQELEGDERIEVSLTQWLQGGGNDADADVVDPSTMVIAIFDDEITGPPPFLVKDIRTVDNNGSAPGYHAVNGRLGLMAGGALYFTADDGLHGTELWRTDGTAAGTVRVSDVNAGPAATEVQHLTAVGSTVYFTAYDYQADRPRVFKVEPGSTEATRLQIDRDRMAVVGMAGVGNLLFIASFNSALWISDGTTSGTALLRSFVAGPGRLTVMGTQLYFVADDGSGTGLELWTSDGTAAGTAPVIDLATGNLSASPQNLLVAGTRLYFDADDGSGIGREPYYTDGTEAGTVLVGDISPGADTTALNKAVAMGDTVYFVHETAAEGEELWKTDGTAAGTTLVKDATPLALSSHPSGLTPVGSALYFTTRGGGGAALWKSDGTEAGTVELSVIDSSTSLYAQGPTFLTALGDSLIFRAAVDTNDRELWISDGTPAGTRVLLERPGTGSPPPRLDPSGFVSFGAELLFSADDGIHGAEVWRTDGTEAGTSMLVDVNQVPRGSNPGSFVRLGSTLVFGADDGIAGYHLWRSDGTTAGTAPLLNDLSGGRLARVGSELFMISSPTAATSGYSIWKTDGTTAGTLRVGAVGSPRDIAAGTDTMYFFGVRDSGADRLWQCDGTEAGTRAVRDAALNEFPPSYSMLAVGSTLYFGGNTTATGAELWKTDGTEAGTVVVKDIVPGAEGSTPTDLTAIGSLVYFVATNSTGSAGLWKTDGTEAGTIELRAEWMPDTTAAPSSLTPVGNDLYFLANSGQVALWKTDGTAAGTGPVKTLPLYAGSYNGPGGLTAVGNTLYFVASNQEENANALWKSDGTEAGTLLLKDIIPPYTSEARPRYLTAFGDLLVFAVDDGFTGEELWRSDGTALGTYRVADLEPGLGSSSPVGLIVMGDTVYFRATTKEVGEEFFGYRP
jgi:ELWxxDGT repeat protein